MRGEHRATAIGASLGLGAVLAVLLGGCQTSVGCSPPLLRRQPVSAI